MRRWAALVVIVLAATSFLSPAPAGAASVTRLSLASAGSGIVLGPDGNLWVAEEFNDSVVRLTPGGVVLARYQVGDRPTTVALGPGGRVWVAVSGAGKLTWFDATSPSPTAHDVATVSSCGPAALVAGGDGRMYFSLPSDGSCNGGVSQLGSVADTGLGGVTTVSGGGGMVFDLAVSGGKLFAPDFEGDVVRRLSLGASPAVESTVSLAAGSGPDGIAADGAGNLWVTAWNSGKVVRFPAAQNGGPAQEVPLAGGALTDPFGILASADGSVYVLGETSANLVRISGDGLSSSFESLPGTRPHTVVDGPDGDLYMTDRQSSTVLRFVDGVPRVSAVSVGSVTFRSAAAAATVDPRGNETRVFFDYGTTSAYGRTAGPYLVAGGAAPTRVTATLTGLEPGTRYQWRVRTTNAEGSTTATQTSFTSRKLPQLSARSKFRYRSGRTTVVTRLSLSRLSGGETVTIRCGGSRCPFRTKVYRHVGKGSRVFGKQLWKGRHLTRGSKVVVLVTKTQTIGRSTTLTVRKNKKPHVVQACVRPGSSRPSPCS